MSGRCRIRWVRCSGVCLLPLFECKNVVYLSIPTLLPTMTVILETGMVSFFLADQVHKQIVCGLHERHKGQFGSPLPPSALTGRWDGGRAAAWWDRRRKREGGVRGPVTDTLSCPELLRQSALPIVRQHPLFFIHHPLCPPPAVLSYNRLWVEALMLTYSCKYLTRRY